MPNMTILEKPTSTFNEDFITAKRYKIEGKYTDERSEKHRDIILIKISNVTSEENPFAALIGGGSGAGKSTIIKEYFAPELDELSDAKEFVYIDSDNIKEEIDEFQQYREAEGDTVFYAAFYVHEESTNIADMLIDECIKRKLSFIYDGTMQWKQQYDELIPKLKDNGYEISGVYVDVDVEKAVKRVETRGKEEKRFVPEEIVRKANRNSAINFRLLEESFDGVMMFNNTEDRDKTDTTPIHPFYKREEPAQKLWDGEILNQEFFSLFLAKSKMSYIE